MAGKSIGNVYAELSVKDKMTVGLQRAGKSLGKFAKMAAVGVAGAGAAAAAGLAVYAKLAVNAASDMSETVSKSNVVFGESSKAMQKWADGAATAMGQSKAEALGAAATLGNMFLAMGTGQEQAADMSKGVVELAADLASFNNTTSEDAIMALGAALRGESEPIRRYNVMLDDAALKAEALSKGLYSGKGNLSQQAKMMAAYSLILKQTKTAQGDFARTSDGLANSTRILSAQWEDAKIELGAGLLPIVTKTVSKLVELSQSGSIDFSAIGQNIASTIDTGFNALMSGDLLDVVALKVTAWAIDVGNIIVSAFEAAFEVISDKFSNMFSDLKAGLVSFGIGDESTIAESDAQLYARGNQRSFSDAFSRNMTAGDKVSQSLKDEADTRWNNNKTGEAIGESISLAMRKAGEDLAVNGVTQPEAAKASSKSWESTNAQVSDLQSRGLSYGNAEVPNLVKDQAQNVKMLYELLKSTVKQGDVIFA